MRKTLLAIQIVVFVAPAAGFAQTRPVKEGRDGRTRLPALQLPTGITREGVTREHVNLAVLPPAPGQQPPRKRSWPGRHPVLFGAITGLGVGLVVEAAVIPGESGGEPHSAYRPMFGGVGAGIGSLAGLIVSARP
jgi:hypothetical protein